MAKSNNIIFWIIGIIVVIVLFRQSSIKDAGTLSTYQTDDGTYLCGGVAGFSCPSGYNCIMSPQQSNIIIYDKIGICEPQNCLAVCVPMYEIEVETEFVCKL